MWSRFDAKAVACYTPYKDRAVALDRELQRVGMRDVQRFWQFPNPYDRVVLDAIRDKSGLMSNIGHFSCSYGHYRIVKTLLTLGYGNALIMEDDIVFLRDTDRLRTVVTSLPPDADVALFEWRTMSWCRKQIASELATVKDGALWHRADRMVLVGCGMYYLSRKGMEWFVTCMERGATGGHLGLSDEFFRPGGYSGGVVPYCAVVRAAVQDSDSRCNSSSPSFVAGEYRHAGLPDFSAYNTHVRCNSRVAIINKFIHDRGYKSYLGVYGASYDVVRGVSAARSVGVCTDPRVQGMIQASPDAYFAGLSPQDKFDIILLDSSHLSDEVSRHLGAALRHLAPGGVVVVHDCLPRNEAMASRDRCSGPWLGDTWKAFAAYASVSPHLCYTVDTDWGCGVVDTAKPRMHGDFPAVRAGDLAWDDYMHNRDALLRVVAEWDFPGYV